MVHPDTGRDNESLAASECAIGDRLARDIERGLPEAENTVWHSHSVWFLDGNQMVGYATLKDGPAGAPPVTTLPVALVNRRRLSLGALVLFVTSLALAGCGASAAPGKQVPPARPPSDWTIAFWAWQPSWGARYAALPDGAIGDEVYVQGQVQRWPGQLLTWPEYMPAAKRYWLLWRFEGEGFAIEHTPPSSLSPQYGAFLKDARRRALRVEGLQIDFDCPTGRLHDYAAWLAVLRRELPKGTRLSVTALLDWFRPGTPVADVIGQVDEFVPQFYDARPPTRAAMSIAEPIDAARWAPVFNRFHVPYRIGISSFGRLRLGSTFSLGPTLLQLLSSPAFDPPTTEATPAGERRLVLRARETTTIEWTRFEAGHALEAVLPTRESVQRAYAEARKMGGYCAGVAFFRWPTDGETLVLGPAEVLRAIGTLPLDATDRVDVVPGDCAAVRCSDLYLRPGEQFPETPRTLALRAGTALEYFLPQPKAARAASLRARDTITVRLPASHGETRLYLGRVMSRTAPAFTIEGGVQ
jgi:hypothetical protein